MKRRRAKRNDPNVMLSMDDFAVPAATMKTMTIPIQYQYLR